MSMEDREKFDAFCVSHGISGNEKEFLSDYIKEVEQKAFIRGCEAESRAQYGA